MRHKLPIFTVTVMVAGASVWWLFPHRAASGSCKAIDADFDRVGQIVVSKVVSGKDALRGQNVGSPEYLDGMLDTLPYDGAGYRYGDVLPTSVHVAIKPQLGIVITSKRPDGSVSASLAHKMDCIDGFWAVTKNIVSGNQTNASYTLIVDQLNDGTLRVQRLLKTIERPKDNVPAGSFDVMAHFKKITP